MPPPRRFPRGGPDRDAKGLRDVLEQRNVIPRAERGDLLHGLLPAPHQMRDDDGAGALVDSAADSAVELQIPFNGRKRGTRPARVMHDQFDSQPKGAISTSAPARYREVRAATTDPSWPTEAAGSAYRDTSAGVPFGAPALRRPSHPEQRPAPESLRHQQMLNVANEFVAYSHVSGVSLDR